MPADHAPTAESLSEGQRRVIDHGEGALLLTGVAGSGRTEALARRLARLAPSGEGVLVLTYSHAAASDLRLRAEEAIEDPFEELAVHPYREAAVRLLREHAVEAGVDPFLERLDSAERLAMLLDRADELPLRRHQIRGNRAGLLARLVERIDALKAAAVTSERFHEWAEQRLGDAADAAERDTAEREAEFARLYEIHDSIIREAGGIDGGEAVLTLSRLLGERPALAAEVARRFPNLIVDELEDACAAELTMLEALARGSRSFVASCDPDQARSREASGGAAWMRRAPVESEEVSLDRSWRYGGGLLDAAHAVISPVPGRLEVPRRPAGPETTVHFWRCANERAEAQATARRVESLLALDGGRAEDICVAVVPGSPDQRTFAAALEERGIPHRISGPGSFFQRPEVRDVIAWLRLLADPADAAAAVRALTKAPVELRSVDLARITTIARRRKLDMISALEAGLESPQIPPEARDRISGFLTLYGAAARAMGEMRADVFVRRLIERIGLRRHRLFGAQPEAAERLRSLSRLGDLAAAWTRREPGGSNRDFVRYLVAVSEAGVSPEDEPSEPAPGAVRVLPLDSLKGLEFEHLFLVGLHAGAIPGSQPAGPPGVPPELGGEAQSHDSEQRRLLYVAMTRASRELVLSRPEATEHEAVRPSPAFKEALAVLGAEEEAQEEELFGPAEGVPAIYRMVQDEVLQEAWRAGGTLNEQRLDTYMDVNRAVARFLELLKVAALIQRQGDERAADALATINDLLIPGISGEQRKALEASGLDDYLLDEERERTRRRELIAKREEPSLEAFLPRRGEGLALSASDIDLYRTCPLKYKFARVFGIPQEPTINQRFGIVIHQVLERFHGPQASGGEEPGSLDHLMSLFEVAWRRSGFGESDDELQFRDRAVEALGRYHARQASSGAQPKWMERKFDFRIGPHHLRGRVDRVDELPDGSYEVIDYKTGPPKGARALATDVQLAIYRLAARAAWQLEAEAAGTYWYVLADEKVDVGSSPDDLERVEAVVLEVGEGIMGQDFEPRPSPEICSWCDFRLICPASEA
ncbi:MAG: ATP-dependent helicase [Solirubrobacterales bacterium]|nr:ATP-dependent helicase [Solirubrobacterales bacterium]